MFNFCFSSGFPFSFYCGLKLGSRVDGVNYFSKHELPTPLLSLKIET